ncbi:LysR family transcriptional regulator [Ruegeria sp. EL01]|jgi:DNA-binding transcriptional LysR family regulator|uniref:LysR family transcriptional regulator n=1 Tax=Ruegeria sp. EL01 TaxID=2107578 RepID=UPI000EA80961|nr:LysR family transcriptional regulator [Ruegeria sp. EL01]
MFTEILKELPTFLVVVESGSFSAAAKRVNLTRSAVAKSVARLEAHLGIQLFSRTTRRLILTDEGARYYEDCNHLVRDLRDVGAQLNKGRTEPIGRVRISTPVLIGRHCVAPILRDLLRSHPQLEIDAEFSDSVVDVLNDGYDLVVRIGSVGNATDLTTRKIGAQDMAIFASPEYLSQRGIPTTIDDLCSHFGIVYGKSSKGLTWRVQDTDGAIHDVLMSSKQRYDDLEVVLDATIEGGGLAWLPRWLGRPHLASGALQLVLDSDQVQPIDIRAVWPKSKFLPLRTRAVIDALIKRVPHFLGSTPEPRDESNMAKCGSVLSL